MVFICQKDSFLKEYDTAVISCDRAEIDIDGKSVKVFEVILEDTVLFPEGGGQPDDRGTIAGLEVLRVTRRGAQAIHAIQPRAESPSKPPLAPGERVHLVVDWTRRFDNMQQHSAQHLVSALFESLLSIRTVCWSLGDQLSTIELGTTRLSDDQLELVGRTANERIRDALPVKTLVFTDASDPDVARLGAHTRGLPADHVGPVRVIQIEGIDNNLCCGTHVSNTAQLQAIALLGTDKGHKGNVQLQFLAGSRVLQAVQRGVLQDRALTKLLDSPPNEHAATVERLQKSLRVANKSAAALMKEMATLEARVFKLEHPELFSTTTSSDGSLHLLSFVRKEGEADFFNTLRRELNSTRIVILVIIGEDKAAGQFWLSGPPALVDELGPKIAEQVGGKGAGKPGSGTFQGRVPSLSSKQATAAVERVRKAVAEGVRTGANSASSIKSDTDVSVEGHQPSK